MSTAEGPRECLEEWQDQMKITLCRNVSGDQEQKMGRRTAGPRGTGSEDTHA